MTELKFVNINVLQDVLVSHNRNQLFVTSVKDNFLPPFSFPMQLCSVYVYFRVFHTLIIVKRQ